MTDRTFASWVEPIAAELRAGREQIAEVARAMSAGAWMKESANPGWTNKDLLAHLTCGDWGVQEGLRKIIAGETLRVGDFADVDGTNARNVGERKERSVEALIAEVEAEGEDTQQLLAQLSEQHETVTPEDAPMIMGDYLRMFPGHDRTHLEQLRAALEA